MGSDGMVFHLFTKGMKDSVDYYLEAWYFFNYLRTTLPTDWMRFIRGRR